MEFEIKKFGRNALIYFITIRKMKSHISCQCGESLLII